MSNYSPGEILKKFTAYSRSPHHLSNWFGNHQWIEAIVSPEEEYSGITLFHYVDCFDSKFIRARLDKKFSAFGERLLAEF